MNGFSGILYASRLTKSDNSVVACGYDELPRIG